MFWGCFSIHGPGPLMTVEGMMDSLKYIDVLDTQLIPAMQQWYPENNGVFQEDLAPCHSSKISKTFKQENEINVLPWPGNSPDLNPIENLWAIIKTKLRSRDCTTKTKMIAAVFEIWNNDELLKPMCKNLVYSMPKRVELLLKAKGGHIKY